MRRLLLAPLLALVLVLTAVGVVSAKPSNVGEVTGEAYFTVDGFVLHEGPTPIGRDGWWRDRVTLRAEGALTLPSGTVDMVIDSTMRRHYNDEFFRYSYTDDEPWPSDWDGFAVGRQVLTMDGVTCEGPANIRFGPDYDAPGHAQLRCDDGSHLWLHYDGGSDVLGLGYPDITGTIRY